MAVKLSKNEKINKLAQELIRSGKWILVRYKNYPILQHIRTSQKLIVPRTPGDLRHVYENFRRDFRHISRQIHQPYILNFNEKP